MEMFVFFRKLRLSNIFSSMKKIYITGVSGTGKSTVSEKLNEKGILSFDIGTIPGLCFWRNKKTHKKVSYSGAGKEWLEAHERICDPKKLEELLKQRNETVMVTGVASNQDEYLKLFDKVFLLYCNPDTFVSRLKNRKNNIFAKTEEEQNEVINWQKTFDPKLRSQGAIPVNSDVPIEDVVEAIIAQLELA
jgi:broad-specificity NMP kinase